MKAKHSFFALILATALARSTEDAVVKDTSNTTKTVGDYTANTTLSPPLNSPSTTTISTGNFSNDASNLREQFKQKFFRNSSANTSKHYNPNVTTIIKTSKIRDGAALIVVTEKYIQTHFEQATQEIFKSSTLEADTEQCSCVCPVVHMSNNSETTSETKASSTVYSTSTNENTKETIRVTENINNDFNGTKKRNDNNKNNQFLSNQRSIDDMPKSCAEVLASKLRASDGTYTIDIFPLGHAEMYCQIDPMGSGCARTFFMRRQKVDDLFDKSWQEYQKGFGELNESFFLGRDNIHALSAESSEELSIITNFETNHIEEERYAYRMLGDESTTYKVEVLGRFSEISVIRRPSSLPKARTTVLGMIDARSCSTWAGVIRRIVKLICFFSAARLSGVHAYLNAPAVMNYGSIFVLKVHAKRKSLNIYKLSVSC